jgi:hypothetical protein
MIGCSCRPVSVHGLAIPVHQDLGVIPFDGICHETTLLVLHKFIPTNCSIAIHVNVVVDIVLDLLLLLLDDKFLQIDTTERLLVELIRGKSPDAETLGEQFLVEFIEQDPCWLPTQPNYQAMVFLFKIVLEHLDHNQVWKHLSKIFFFFL